MSSSGDACAVALFVPLPSCVGLLRVADNGHWRVANIVCAATNDIGPDYISGKNSAKYGLPACRADM